MKEKNINKSFWNALDELLKSCETIIDRPKGTKHPSFPDCIYPFDYGYLKGTMSMDGSGIDIWKGNGNKNMINGIICTFDVCKKDSEVKILIDCNQEEKGKILEFHNENKMFAILINRD
jgi:inorganic pyrophosphatase